ncbi:hypothetical protein NQK81_01385 [Amycolatopsis roodepoortensis]|uniref:hypothetical protein n=1 Tax=Amycolatopsis roodepoortensis TaxID=700274 RepID=UPI00214BB955|nr:hypothetical protein [Amycolatopsis roodepoortensis]UUV32128.1 hypothetical protein NQK81_01385 [Amycolatopsis roodepoortensis]
MPTHTEPVLPAREVTLPEGAPITVTATVLSVDRRSEAGVFGPMVGLEAHLHVLFPGDTTPDTLFLSRLAEESWWLQDAHFSNGLPHFSHGFGSRTVRKHGVPTELDELLCEAARARGLVTEIGPGIPLALATSSTPA